MSLFTSGAGGEVDVRRTPADSIRIWQATETIGALVEPMFAHVATVCVGCVGQAVVYNCKGLAFSGDRVVVSGGNTRGAIVGVGSDGDAGGVGHDHALVASTLIVIFITGYAFVGSEAACGAVH